MDDIDRAQEFDNLFRQAALIRHDLGRDPVVVINQDQSKPRVCIDCGDEIPLARLEINPRAVRCVACQVEHERPRRAVSG